MDCIHSNKEWNSATPNMSESHKRMMSEGSNITCVHTVGLLLQGVQEEGSLVYGDGGQESGWPWELLTGKRQRASGVQEISHVLI